MAHGNASADSWLIQVKHAFDGQHRMRQVSENVCIYRVPRAIMVCKPQAYEPMVVSLGPYHHKPNPKLSAMDQHKLEAVHRMLGRLNGVTIDDIISKIQVLESEIRECYDEEIKWNRETLCWVLAMDACFILEYIRMESDTDRFSLVFQNPGRGNQTTFAIINDILKLENQIPLLILITLLQLECNGNRGPAVQKLATILSQFRVFKGYPFYPLLSDDKVVSILKEHIEKKKGARHLLDLNRMVIKDLLTHSSSQSATAGESANGSADIMKCFHEEPRSWWMDVASWAQQQRWYEKIVRISPPSDNRSTPRAELLHMAGINFNQAGEVRFEKSWFGQGTLSLPQITVDDDTEAHLRNLMAYEECQRCSRSPEDTVISQFICLIDVLIDSEKDVCLLRKDKIIINYLGNDQIVADMFNGICDRITMQAFEPFERVIEEARGHYNSRWKLWLNQFKEEHFSKPWSVISLVAAVILLVMTAVQTLNSGKDN